MAYRHCRYLFTLDKDRNDMKAKLVLIALTLATPGFVAAQEAAVTPQQRQEIVALIDAYSEARAKQDRTMLESILTAEVDQLTSSGEWRKGKEGSMQGMGRSSQANPGTRTLTVQNVRLLGPQVALVDARYDIRSPQGVTRNMWSSFMVVQANGKWRISAIRNMLPTNQ
jgi:uncharacterized protein (TIGR02246 family)